MIIESSDPAVGPRPRLGRLDRWSLLLVPAVALLVGFFVIPLGRIFVLSFSEADWTIGNYRQFFTSSVYPGVLRNTLVIALLVTGICLVLAYPYAYLMTIADRRWTVVLLFLVLIPFWTSLLVRSFAWLLLLQDTGLINRTLINLGVISEPIRLIRNNTGVVIGTVHVLLPFMIVPLYANMRGIDLRLVAAAESLGARPARAFWNVFVPLSRPGVIAGCLLTFILTLGFYVTPELLGSPSNVMLGQLIVQQVSQLLNWGLGSAIAVILLVATFVVLAVVSRVFRLERGPGTLR